MPGDFDVCSRETQDEDMHPASSHTGDRAADGTPDRELRRQVYMHTCTSNVFMYQALVNSSERRVKTKKKNRELGKERRKNLGDPPPSAEPFRRQLE